MRLVHHPGFRCRTSCRASVSGRRVFSHKRLFLVQHFVLWIQPCCRSPGSKAPTVDASLTSALNQTLYRGLDNSETGLRGNSSMMNISNISSPNSSYYLFRPLYKISRLETPELHDLLEPDPNSKSKIIGSNKSKRYFS